MVALLAATLILTFTYQQGCNSSKSPTAPHIVEQPTATIPANAGQIATTPQTAEEPASQEPDPVDGNKVKFNDKGDITLDINKEWVWTACVYTYTDYLKQSFSHAFRVTNGFNEFEPGDWCGTKTFQIDVQTGAQCPEDPFVGPFDGFRRGRAGLKWEGEACCQPTQRELEPLLVEIGEWSECAAPVVIDSLHISTKPSPPPPPVGQCPGEQTRTLTYMPRTINTCTEEITVGEPYHVEQKQECTYACQPGICHTENSKWCWAGTNDCSNFWFIGKVEKWQCQNVPPDTPGHFPNHFQEPYGSSNSHDDFFGDVQNPTAPACIPEKCYSIIN